MALAGAPLLPSCRSPETLPAVGPKLAPQVEARHPLHTDLSDSAQPLRAHDIPGYKREEGPLTASPRRPRCIHWFSKDPAA